MQKLKILLLHIAKICGLFVLARKLTNSGLRIVCYHGFSRLDEHLFRPNLFMSPTKFKKHLACISKMGFDVVSLDDAVTKLKANSLAPNTLVFTVDDGWQGVGDIAEPIFRKFGFDWTLYLTSYYSAKQTPVYNMLVQYLCWKAEYKTYDFSTLGPVLNPIIQTKSDSNFNSVSNVLVDRIEKLENSGQKDAFARCLANVLKIDYDVIERSRLFHLISAESANKLDSKGVHIELHTHRHSLGDMSESVLRKEIADNIRFISDACSNVPRHFCYPSGEYTQNHLSWLTSMDVASATTCHSGANYKSANVMELSRILDGENLTQIELEAELSGFKDLFRGAMRRHLIAN